MSLLPVAGVRPRPIRQLSKKKLLNQPRIRLTTWPDMDVPTQPDDLIATRVLLLRDLVQSLEVSQFALARNDAEMIARGAARQAELCRQWSLLEDQMRRDFGPIRSSIQPAGFSSPKELSEASPSLHLEKEFDALTVRIRHLTRVHCSLLRHLQRSLAILVHVVDSCAPTYTADLSAPRAEIRPQAGD
jgi:hypothetical protein